MRRVVQSILVEAVKMRLVVDNIGKSSLIVTCSMFWQQRYPNSSKHKGSEFFVVALECPLCRKEFIIPDSLVLESNGECLSLCPWCGETVLVNMDRKCSVNDIHFEKIWLDYLRILEHDGSNPY